MSWFKISPFKYWPQTLVLLLLATGYGCYRYFAYYDTHSSDAYVSANIVNIAPAVTGPVTCVYVKDNQKVGAGEKLFAIESLPFTYAVEQARAKRNAVALNYKQQQSALLQAEQKLKQLQTTRSLTHQRYLELTRKKNGNYAVRQQLAAELKQDDEAIIKAMHEFTRAQSTVDDNELLAAQAALQEAEYQLKHTVIYAPAAGYVSNVTLRQGQYVKAGEPLFALIESKKWWIETRYRETAIRLIKPGDKALIKIDMYPGKTFHGHVTSIGWGINRIQAGNVASSSLVYLQPTEDWIQIAQRFPVQIEIDDASDEYLLRVGASAATTTYR